MRFYLAGAIEYSPDLGRAWRQRLAAFLRGLGHDVYDPVEDELKSLTEEERANFRGWKKTDLARYRVALRKIIDFDLDVVEHRSDAVIALWDSYAARGAGTQGELSLAYRRGKPVFLVAAMPVTEISGWILGCATEVFASFEELEARLASDLGKSKAAARG
ncbi:MAG TPA: nucleoside 2-deoxyribosyltransferase [Myxococcales bacterium]